MRSSFPPKCQPLGLVLTTYTKKISQYWAHFLPTFNENSIHIRMLWFIWNFYFSDSTSTVHSEDTTDVLTSISSSIDSVGAKTPPEFVYFRKKDRKRNRRSTTIGIPEFEKLTPTLLANQLGSSSDESITSYNHADSNPGRH